MKSERAKEHIARKVFSIDNDAFLPPIITRDNCNKAVELAEQDAEERYCNDIARYKQDLKDSRSREVIATKIIEDKRKEIEMLKAKAVDAFLLACEKQVDLGGEIKREMYELFINKLTER